MSRAAWTRSLSNPTGTSESAPDYGLKRLAIILFQILFQSYPHEWNRNCRAGESDGPEDIGRFLLVGRREALAVEICL